MEIKKILNKRYTFVILFLILILTYTLIYFNGNRSPEVGYSIVFFFMGLVIASFYVIKDYILNPSRMNYRKIVMEQPLYNHRGKITKEVDAFPLHRDFVTLYLGRTSEDPYGATVTSLQSVRYRDNLMTDSLFIPIETSDPLLQKYTLSLGDAIAKFNKFAGSYPVVTYNHPFTHTYLSIKLDKEFTLSSLDAMRMSKDIYGLFNEPIKKISKHLHLHNLDGDELAGAKVIGAIYLDYMVTLTHYKNREMRKARRLERSALKEGHPQKEAPQQKVVEASPTGRAGNSLKEAAPDGATPKVTATPENVQAAGNVPASGKTPLPEKDTSKDGKPETVKTPVSQKKRTARSDSGSTKPLNEAKAGLVKNEDSETTKDPVNLKDSTDNLV